MNWKEIFFKYCDWCKSKYGTEIHLYPIQNPESPNILNFYCDGATFFDEADGWSGIDFYYEESCPYDILLCVLIHEIGHVMCFNHHPCGKLHSEEDAWFWGEFLLDQNNVPDCFDLVKAEALDSYVEITEISYQQ
jgi:hypothetical protein